MDPASIFEQVFSNSDDFVCISIKINLPTDIDVSNVLLTGCDQLTSAYYYIKEVYKTEILASTVGLHLKGEHAIPHFHYACITPWFKPPANNSTYKARFLAKDQSYNLDNTSFKISRFEQNTPKYQSLSYPLKEGHPLVAGSLQYKQFFRFQSQVMDRETFRFLLDTGVSIYNTQLGLRLRQDKTEDRKKQSLLDIYNIVKDKKFSNFSELKNYLEDHYLAKLSLEEKPKFSNYRDNLYAIGNTLGIYRYADHI